MELTQTYGTGLYLFRSKIGKEVKIGQNVYIADNVVVGDNCKIQNNVSIYDGVTLESDVLWSSMVFTNVSNPRSHLNRKFEFKKTLIKKEQLEQIVQLYWSYSWRICFCHNVAVVTKNVKPYALIAGVPSKQIGWMSKHGEKLDLPILGNAKAVCKSTGQFYQLKDNKVTIV